MLIPDINYIFSTNVLTMKTPCDMSIIYYSDEFFCHNNTHVRSLRRSNFVRSKSTVITVRYIVVAVFFRYVNMLKPINCIIILCTFFFLRASRQHLCALYALNFNVFNYCLSLLISLIMVYCFLIVHQVFNFVEPVNVTNPHWQLWNGNAHTSGHFCFRYDQGYFFLHGLKIRYTVISYTMKSFRSKSVNHGEWLPSSIISFWHCQILNWQYFR